MRNSEKRKSQDLYVYWKQKETRDWKKLEEKLELNFAKIICEVIQKNLRFKYKEEASKEKESKIILNCNYLVYKLLMTKSQSSISH